MSQWVLWSSSSSSSSSFLRGEIQFWRSRTRSKTHRNIRAMEPCLLSSPTQRCVSSSRKKIYYLNSKLRNFLLPLCIPLLNYRLSRRITQKWRGLTTSLRVWRRWRLTDLNQDKHHIDCHHDAMVWVFRLRIVPSSKFYYSIFKMIEQWKNKIDIMIRIYWIKIKIFDLENLLLWWK